MTNITELAQSLKAAAEKWQEAWGKYDKVEITIAEFIRAANQYESIVKDPANVLALVEALESEKRICATWRKTAEANSEKLEKAQQRIGKLEKKLTDHKRMNQEMAKAMLTPNDSDAAGMEIAALRQRIAELESRTVTVKQGEVLVTVAGFTGCGKSAIAGEIEIAMKAIGLPVTWANGDSEKRMTGADWLTAIEMYKPTVRIVEVNIPRAAGIKWEAE
ncbi:RelE family toxin-antitoxin system [Klebsiella pneumoniae]|uniref:ead/Ea22-like family protein n=1 Tax=Klebsiella pneumoniae TaxID=573 RepID=UPI0010EE21FA|nr:ead/Ea22-like family protein [Klebsiella pneumoniae]VGD12324.1 RelE family toxin-antitoxin system [Klebsiella pneumoniae]